MSRKIILTLLVLVFVVPEAWAQGFYMGPQFGFHKSQEADGNVLIGAAARLRFTPALGMEGSINYRQEDFTGMTVRSWPVMVTGLIYPLPVVYGALGGGWYNTTFDFENELLDNETQQEFGWHFGAGLELNAGKSKFVGDIRYVFLNYNFEDVPFSDVDSDFFVITAGFLFGL